MVAGQIGLNGVHAPLVVERVIEQEQGTAIALLLSMEDSLVQVRISASNRVAVYYSAHHRYQVLGGLGLNGAVARKRAASLLDHAKDCATNQCLNTVVHHASA